MINTKKYRIAKLIMFLQSNGWQPVSKRRICLHLKISERTFYRYVSSEILSVQINNGFVSIITSK